MCTSHMRLAYFVPVLCLNVQYGPQWLHDDVIKWKHFPRYWSFVRGIHRWPVNSPSQRPVTRSFDVFCDLCLNKRLSKHSWGRWFETPSHPLWRHCNVIGYTMIDEVYIDHHSLSRSIIFVTKWAVTSVTVCVIEFLCLRSLCLKRACVDIQYNDVTCKRIGVTVWNNAIDP